MDELTLDDKIYISSKRAAVITGYAKDYVGQLCREGRVEARLVGRSWYVLEDSIKAHRFGGQVTEEVKFEQKQVVDEPLVHGVVDEKPNENEVIFEHRYFQEEVTPLKEIENIAEQTQHENEHQIVAMQDAWKEWFDGKKDTVAGEVNHSSNDDEDNSLYSLDNSEGEYNEVPLHIIREVDMQPEPEVDNITPLLKEHISNEVTPAPISEISTMVHESPVGESAAPRGNFVLLKAVLVSVLLIVVSITVISIGIVESTGVQTNGFFMILSGETKI